ncbi:hypothetical protein HUJ05_000108 [Dendroctonus ponderosae]|nr:hypothetical protein HUJ05_000108 [Dendroctonus ponderosae]
MFGSESLAKLFGRSTSFLLLLLYFVEPSASDATPEDWVPNSLNFNLNGEDNTFISAYLNVTFKTDHGWKWDKTDVGRYGGSYIGPAYGLLVHVTSKHDQADHFGCIYPYDSSRSDGKLPHSGTPWIALIKRGKCNFDVKVDNAFKSGAGGVLIYNDRMAPTLDKMKLTNDPRLAQEFEDCWRKHDLSHEPTKRNLTVLSRRILRAN